MSLRIKIRLEDNKMMEAVVAVTANYYHVEDENYVQPDISSITFSSGVWPEYTYGYWCQGCGLWVNWGESHVCPCSNPYYYPWPWNPVPEDICPDCGEVVERCPTCGKIKKDK